MTVFDQSTLGPEEQSYLFAVGVAARRVCARGGAASTMLDPISGKAVPVAEMSEHMRVQLMDPKYVLLIYIQTVQTAAHLLLLTPVVLLMVV